MKTLVIALGIMFFPHILIGQYSFETVINSEKDEGLYYSFETSYGSFMAVGFSQALTGSPKLYAPLIIEVNNQGEITKYCSLVKQDTSYLLFYGLEKPTGNFYFVGMVSEHGTNNKNRIIYVCETTPEMEIIWETYHHMPNEVRKGRLIHFLTMPDNTILFQGKADTSEMYTTNYIFTGYLDLNGNLLDLKFFYNPFMKEFGVYSDMIFNFDTTAIFFFGSFARGPSNFTTSFFEIDFDFNLISFSEYVGGKFLTAPTSVAWLPNGNLILADRENNYGAKAEGLLVMLLAPDFTFIQDTFMVRPGMVYLPMFNGLDYTDPDNIWIATFNAMGSSTPTEVFHVQVFDSEMNLKGVKEYGGEKKLYRFYNLLATSDGGCLITGQVPACDTCQNNSGYLFKVMPEDVVITSINEQSCKVTYSVEVFPNPFTENLTVHANAQGLTISVHDFTGNKVIETEIQTTGVNLKTGHLSKGIYFYQIFENGNVIKHGKLIKH
ncbi:MAG: T9SS type A sorting domain-containing protein [Bacteroidales bacterium]